MVENESIDNLVTLERNSIHDNCLVQVDIDQGALLTFEFEFEFEFYLHREAPAVFCVTGST